LADADRLYRHLARLSVRPRRACLGGAERAGAAEPAS